MKQPPKISTKGSTRISAILVAAAVCIATVFGIVQGEFSDNERTSSPGSSYTEVLSSKDGSKLDYVSQDLSSLTGLPDDYEAYSDLDRLGRCGLAVAKVGQKTIPAKDAKRDNESISKVHPAGWSQAFYEDVIDGNNGALYNRCHLIAYSLAGESGNELNLMTGTAQLNNEMNTYEKRMKRYILDTGNHVVYRVTPDFQDDELVARGIRLEALSVEDGGAGIDIDVYIPNVQDGIEIDYKTGKSRQAE